MPTRSLPFDEIKGKSVQIGLIEQCIDRVALSEASALLTGESGTGKELFARRAHRGTLFLDEIGALSPSAQATLLHVIEQREIRPLGSPTAQTIDFRLVAATNRNLEQLASQGQFRQDLLFRINVVHVHIPPLRDRREDISLIANSFLAELGVQHSRTFARLTSGAQRRLAELPWLGHARELRNIVACVSSLRFGGHYGTRHCQSVRNGELQCHVIFNCPHELSNRAEAATFLFRKSHEIPILQDQFSDTFRAGAIQRRA